MKKNNKPNSNQKGFTIIELMISTVIFSIVLLICIQGMVQVSRAYYKGLTHTRTQEAARQLLDEITQTIQLSGSAVTILPPVDSGPTVATGASNTASGTGIFCAGNKKYTYAIDRKVTASTDHNRKEINNAMIAEEVACSDALTPGNLNVDVSGTTRSLIGEDMRITKFSVTRVVPDPTVPIKDGSELWRVELSLAYGDQDLLSTDNDANPWAGTYVDDLGNSDGRVICSAKTGDEFCSIVELSTIVARRIS